MKPQDSNFQGSGCLLPEGGSVESDEREDFDRASSNRPSSNRDSNGQIVNNTDNGVKNHFKEPDGNGGQNDEDSDDDLDREEQAAASTPQLNDPASPSVPSMMRQEIDTSGLALGEIQMASQASPPHAPGQFPSLKL